MRAVSKHHHQANGNPRGRWEGTLVPVDDPGMRGSFDRELYRHSDPVRSELAGSAEQLRERLEEIAHRLQRDATQAAPWGDPSLTSSGGMKRRYKILLHRLLRPVSRRYDRLSAELARACVDLADLLVRSETEARRLRQEIAQLEERVRGLSPSDPAAATRTEP
jgi:hypothetical protein